MNINRLTPSEPINKFMKFFCVSIIFFTTNTVRASRPFFVPAKKFIYFGRDALSFFCIAGIFDYFVFE